MPSAHTCAPASTPVKWADKMSALTGIGYVSLFYFFLKMRGFFTIIRYGSRQIKDGNQPRRFYFLLSDQGKR